MCGLVGVLSTNPEERSESVISAMMEAVAHRGPDDSGQYEFDPIALGFQRLSVIDIPGGHQPMTSSDRRYTIVFNGEIYNHREIREQVVHPVLEFNTSSDTEVILFAYDRWEERAFAHFNGMFALAIWDNYERRLTLARDRAGKKPLYYFIAGETLIFASEVKAIAAHPAYVTAISDKRLVQSLAYRYVPKHETLFEGIQSLPPGHYAHINPDTKLTVAPQAYCELFARYAGVGIRSAISLSDKVALYEFNRILTDSVVRRLTADVPVGAFLSGGIDSSLIVAAMAGKCRKPVQTFSVGFDTGFSELPYAEIVSRRFGTVHHSAVCTADDLLNEIPNVLWHRETPISEPSDIPLYLLAREARKHVTVVLSGEGSDELFCGYPKYQATSLASSLPGSLANPLLAAANKAAGKFRRHSRLSRALSAIADPDPIGQVVRWFGAFSMPELEHLLHPNLLPHVSTALSPTYQLATRYPQAGKSELMQIEDFSHWLPANLLLRSDRVTMAHALELRCPFLDPQMIEFSIDIIKLSQKVRRGRGKWIVHQLARQVLPKEIYRRKKWGFKVPVDSWFRGPLRNSLRETLLSSRAKQRNLFNPAVIEKLVASHLSGEADNTIRLWDLYQLELWHQMFLDKTLKPGQHL